MENKIKEKVKFNFQPSRLDQSRSILICLFFLALFGFSASELLTNYSSLLNVVVKVLVAFMVIQYVQSEYYFYRYKKASSSHSIYTIMELSKVTGIRQKRIRRDLTYVVNKNVYKSINKQDLKLFIEQSKKKRPKEVEKISNSLENNNVKDINK